MQSVGLGRHDRGRCGHTGGVGWRKAGADCAELCTVYCTLTVVDVEREDLMKLDVGCIHSTMIASRVHQVQVYLTTHVYKVVKGSHITATREY